MNINNCNDYTADFERTSDWSSLERVVSYLKEINLISLAHLVEEYQELKEKIDCEEYLPESTIDERVEEKTDDFKEAVKKMIDYYTYECFDDRREKFGYAIIPLRQLEDLESQFHSIFGDFE
jgi:hypothetical protein